MSELPRFDLAAFSKRDFRALVIGASGSGKTYFCKKLLRFVQQQNTKILVMDAKREFDYKELGFVQIGNWDRSINKMKEQYEVGGYVINTPLLVSEYMACIGWHLAPTVLYYEEIVEYIGKGDNLPVSHPFVYKCLQQGRAKRIRMIFATQMVAQTNLALLRQATDIFIFRMRKEELRKVEKLLSLDTGALDFGKPEDHYRFYHVNSLDSPVKYEKLEFTRRGRKKKEQE